MTSARSDAPYAGVAAARLTAAGVALRAAVRARRPDSLTVPEQSTGEQWDTGQVLAHVAEMLPYWVAQVHVVLGGGGDGVPFGRIKTDPARVAAIARDRGVPAAFLLSRIDHGVAQAAALVGRLSASDLVQTGRHQTLGVMTVARIVEEFLVGHLEEHAAQLV